MSSPKPDLRDLATRFSRKARSDEIALDKLAGDPDVPDDLIGFHAQQALEKLLKAALAHAGVRRRGTASHSRPWRAACATR